MMLRRLGKKRFKKIAEYVSVGLGDNAIQLITDAMANSQLIEIEYLQSGFRKIAPYGWSVSKDNNLLLMSYKEDSSIRSYRFDRILQVFVDDSLINAYNNVEQQNVQENNMPNNSPDDYLIPMLPNIDQIIEESESEEAEMPYDDAIESLENAQEVELNIDNTMSQEELVNSITNNELDENPQDFEETKEPNDEIEMNEQFIDERPEEPIEQKQ